MGKQDLNDQLRGSIEVSVSDETPIITQGRMVFV